MITGNEYYLQEQGRNCMRRKGKYEIGIIIVIIEYEIGIVIASGIKIGINFGI